jgi:hypothetical protein
LARQVCHVFSITYDSRIFNDLMELYDSISLLIIFGEVDSVPLEHVLFNILDFDITYTTLIGILTLCQYRTVIVAQTMWC